MRNLTGVLQMISSEELFYTYRNIEEQLQYKFTTGDMEGLSVAIRLATQHCAVLRREKVLDINEIEMIGKIEGMVEAYSDVYNTVVGKGNFEEAREKLGTDTFDSIITTIYKKDGFTGVLHDTLSKTLNIKWGELTKIMEIMLLNNIVTVTGIGPTTRYSLTTRTIQYCIRVGLLKGRDDTSEK